MKLQSIEIKGFKSFYKRTRIEFPDGIISIVGPNGSGKSNILDAFRWVLGEQSAKSLRGEKMDDVIFSGTKKHTQSNYCEVEIVLDNSDNAVDSEFSEISIKRKTYREGDTKYYINGKNCRLKDIKELFLDSGIGKEGYSIISQGKIDEIINASSSERRKLLEEASGISGYRYKKEESEKLIRDSKANLERLVDIYTEIERQIKPLELQCQKAEKFLVLSEDLKQTDISLMLKEYDDIFGLVEINNSKKTAAQEKVNLLGTQLSKLKNEIEDLDKKKKEYELILQALEKDQNRIKLEKNNRNNQIEFHKEKIEIRKNIVNKLLNEKETLQADLKAEDIQINELEANLINLKESIEKVTKKLEGISDSTRDLTAKLTSLDHEIVKTIKTQEGKAAEINKLEKLIFIAQENLNRQEHTKKDREANLKKYRGNLNELLVKIDAEKNQEELLRKSLSEIQVDKDRKSIELEEAHKTINIWKNKISAASFALKDSETRRHMYLKMEQDMDGFNKSVKAVLTNRALEGIVDVVSNIIKTEIKYEKAIETALGPALQHIITENSSSAKIAIEFLKNNKAGRATFIPMDTVKSNPLRMDNMLIASDVVICDNKYKNIINTLLGRTILADNMDAAILIGKKYEQRYKVVTLDGEVFSPGGSITGGHYYKSNEILSRKRQIENLDLLIKSQTAELKDVENSLAKASEHEDGLRQIRANIDKELERRREDLNLITSSKTEMHRRAMYIRSEIAGLEKEEEEYFLDKKDLGAEIARLKDRFDNFEEEARTHKEQLFYAEQDKNRLAAELSGKNEEKNEARLKLVAFESKKDNLEGDLKRFLKNKEIISDKIEKSKEEIYALYAEIKISEVAVENSVLDLQLFQVEQDELSSEHEDAILGLKKESQRLDSVLSESKEIDGLYMKALEEKYMLDADLGKTSLLEAQIVERLNEDYGLTVDTARQYRIEDASKTGIAKLKKEIQSLGNINLDAIEEYGLLKERYETYKIQIEDLDLSIQGLEQIIGRLEMDMASEFKKNFEIINSNFEMIFESIFGGGEAKLILSNPSDVLNSDIEILAQPPGKKLRTMSVLSGGEKSLMGIALLFAIQMTKPAPFCILDEIDAALDDANISRFNAFLKEMSKDIQFVTITHRRGTMETSDYIYGITMQDKGVSDVVSIKFEDAQEYIEQ